MAFCLDSAVAEFGAYVESELEKVKGKTEKAREAARKNRLETLLSDKESESKKFADPMQLIGEKRGE